MSTSPLFVRIPSAQAEKLDRAAFELRTPKQELVAGLVARYVDPSSSAGLDALRALRLDEGPLVGRASFRPYDDGDVLTTAQLARLLQVDERVVRRLARHGELPGRRVGRQWRFSRQAVLDWLGRPAS
jgi:excisionase family DNA binding protein